MKKLLLTAVSVIVMSEASYGQGLCYESTKAFANGYNNSLAIGKSLGFSEFPALLAGNRLKFAAKILASGNSEAAVNYLYTQKNVEAYEMLMQSNTNGSTYSEMFVVNTNTCGIKHLINFKANDTIE